MKIIEDSSSDLIILESITCGEGRLRSERNIERYRRNEFKTPLIKIPPHLYLPRCGERKDQYGKSVQSKSFVENRKLILQKIAYQGICEEFSEIQNKIKSKQLIIIRRGLPNKISSKPSDIYSSASESVTKMNKIEQEVQEIGKCKNKFNKIIKEDKTLNIPEEKCEKSLKNEFESSGEKMLKTDTISMTNSKKISKTKNKPNNNRKTQKEDIFIEITSSSEESSSNVGASKDISRMENVKMTRRNLNRKNFSSDEDMVIDITSSENETANILKIEDSIAVFQSRGVVNYFGEKPSFNNNGNSSNKTGDNSTEGNVKNPSDDPKNLTESGKEENYNHLSKNLKEENFQAEITKEKVGDNSNQNITVYSESTPASIFANGVSGEQPVWHSELVQISEIECSTNYNAGEIPNKKFKLSSSVSESFVNKANFFKKSISSSEKGHSKILDLLDSKNGNFENNKTLLENVSCDIDQKESVSEPLISALDTYDSKSVDLTEKFEDGASKYRILFRNKSYEKEFVMRANDSLEAIFKTLFGESMDGRLFSDGFKLSKFLTVKESGFFPGINYITLSDEDEDSLKSLYEITVQLSENQEENIVMKFSCFQKISEIVEKVKEKNVIADNFLCASFNGFLLDDNAVIGHVLESCDVIDLVSVATPSFIQ